MPPEEKNRTAIPPKTLHNLARARTFAPDGTPLHPRRVGAGDSLPVLEAFQEFITLERERARSRLRITLLCLGLILLVVLAGSALVGAIVFRHIGSLQKGLQQVEAGTAQSVAETRNNLSEVASQSLALRTAIEQQTATLRDVRSEFNARNNAQQDDLTAIKTQLCAVVAENLLLKKDLTKIQNSAAQPAPVEDVSSILQKIDGLPARSNAPETLELQIRPSATGPSIAWKIPLP